MRLRPPPPVKPPATSINWSHPLTRGLVKFYLMHESTPTTWDLVSGKATAPTSGVTCSAAARGNGLGRAFAADGDYIAQGSTVFGNGDLTLAGRAIPAPNRRGIISTGGTGVHWHLLASVASKWGNILVGGVNLPSTVPAGDVQNDNDYTVVSAYVLNVGITVLSHNHTTSVTEIGTGSSAISPSNEYLGEGGHIGMLGAGTANGCPFISWGGIWGRALSTSEMALLIDPRVILRTRQRVGTRGAAAAAAAGKPWTYQRMMAS